MPASHRCSVPSCDRPAIASCFECERFCCENHLSAISLTTATRSIRVQVCPACLRRYRLDPSIESLLSDDATPTPLRASASTLTD